MKILRTKELLKIYNLTNFKQTKAKLNLEWPNEYINHLLESKLVKDFEIIYLDTNNTKLFYKDLIFLKNNLLKNDIENGFFIENVRKYTPKIISKEEHVKNIINFDLLKINPYECIDLNNLTFIKDPFSDFKLNSRGLASFITWKYNLNYKLLLFDILKIHNLTKKCIICNDDFVNVGCDTTACKKCTFKYNNKILINKVYNKIELVNKIKNIECPICGDSFIDTPTILTNKISLLAKHFTRKHKFTIQHFIKSQNIDNSKCKCGNEKSMLPFCDLLSYNNKLAEIFYDFDIEKDFLFFKHTCKSHSCNSKNLIIMFKKIYTFKDNINDLEIIEIIEEIRNNYHNIEKYEIEIKQLLTILREYTRIRNIEMNGFTLQVYSKLEELSLKNIILKNDINQIYSSWEINRKIFDFKYIFNNNEHRYVPDFFIKSDNKNILYEIKSGFTLGYYFKQNIIKNEDIFKRNLKKFKSAYTYCSKNNIIFNIIIDDREYEYMELLNEFRKRKLIR